MSHKDSLHAPRRVLGFVNLGVAQDFLKAIACRIATLSTSKPVVQPERRAPTIHPLEYAFTTAQVERAYEQICTRNHGGLHPSVLIASANRFGFDFKYTLGTDAQERLNNAIHLLLHLTMAWPANRQFPGRFSADSLLMNHAEWISKCAELAPAAPAVPAAKAPRRKKDVAA